MRLLECCENLQVRTLVFLRNFGSFFNKHLISKNANIHAMGPLHLHYASHLAGSRFLEISSVNHFFFFFFLIAGPDRRFLLKFRQFLPQTFNFKNANSHATGPFCTFIMRPMSQEDFWTVRPSTIWSKF